MDRRQDTLESDEANSFRFNESTFDRQLERTINLRRSGALGIGGIDSARLEIVERALADVRAAAVRQRAWLKSYSGKIPSNWGESPDGDMLSPTWIDVIDHVRNPSLSLSGEMIQAAAAHPHHSVVEALGTHHRLSEDLLRYIDDRADDEVPFWVKEHIRQAQTTFALDPDALSTQQPK